MDTFYHGSPSAIPAIRADGLFGGVFVSVSAAAARSHGDVLHAITSPRPLTNFELNYEVPGAWECALELCDGDEVRAEAIMSCECVSEEADEAWELQRLRGALASRLGFTSIEMLDEHGTTWLCLPGCDGYS